jgi:hypothetical protein
MGCINGSLVTVRGNRRSGLVLIPSRVPKRRGSVLYGALRLFARAVDLQELSIWSVHGSTGNMENWSLLFNIYNNRLLASDLACRTHLSFWPCRVAILIYALQYSTGRQLSTGVRDVCSYHLTSEECVPLLPSPWDSLG